MIGDTPFDAEVARGADLACIAVYRDAAPEGAKAVADKDAEVVAKAPCMLGGVEHIGAMAKHLGALERKRESAAGSGHWSLEIMGMPMHEGKLEWVESASPVQSTRRAPSANGPSNGRRWTRDRIMEWLGR